MNTIGYLFVFIAALLVRGMTKGRTFTELPEDLADFFVAVISQDLPAVNAVLARTTTPTTSTDTPGKTVGTASPIGKNGYLADTDLVGLSFTLGRLAPTAAADLEKLNIEYRAEFGKNMTVTDTYRNWAGQVAARTAKGRMAADPGTSQHGWGKAIDAGGGINTWGSTQRNWMVANAPRHGWTSPGWAQLGGSKPEAWHWEHA